MVEGISEKCEVYTENYFEKSRLTDRSSHGKHLSNSLEGERQSSDKNLRVRATWKSQRRQQASAVSSLVPGARSRRPPAAIIWYGCGRPRLLIMLNSAASSRMEYFITGH